MLHMQGTGPFPSLSVRSADAGTIVYPPGSTYGPRVQKRYQLVLLHSGNAVIEIDNKEHLLQAGQVAFLKPGHQEMFTFAEREETWHRWIHIDCEYPEEDVAEELERLPFAMPLKESFNQLTDQMLAVQRKLGMQLGSALLHALGLSALYQYVAECRSAMAFGSLHPAVLLAQRVCWERLEEPLTVGGLAAAVNVTKEHLIRLFRRDQGVTPMKYLWRLRVERGVELLRATGLSVGEIARRCGFQTSYHFARMVKTMTGCTPTEIRQKSLRGEAGTITIKVQK